MTNKDDPTARAIVYVLVILMILLAIPALAFAWDQHKCSQKVSSAISADHVASASGRSTTAAQDAARASQECLSTQGLAIWVEHKVRRE